MDAVLAAYVRAVNRIDDVIEYALPMPPASRAAIKDILDDLTRNIGRLNDPRYTLTPKGREMLK